MNGVQFLILGAIAVLVGVVLIGPVTSTVESTTSQGSCPTAGGSADDITSPSSSHTTAATDVVVGVETTRSSPAATYAAGTLCRTTGSTAPPSTGVIPAGQLGNYYLISSAPGGQVAGPLGFGFMSSRALAILIPLIFVACILVIPIYVCWEKMKNGNGGM